MSKVSKAEFNRRVRAAKARAGTAQGVYATGGDLDQVELHLWAAVQELVNLCADLHISQTDTS